MKKIFLIALAFVFCMGMITPVYAADFHKSVDKFAEGAMEVMKSPLVLHDHTKSEMDSAEHKPVGFLKGLMEAPFHMVKKAGGGVLDMVTFPVD